MDDIEKDEKDTTIESSPPIIGKDGKALRLRSGVCYDLEELADQILAEARKGVTALSERRDYLTRDQLQLRASREITNATGVSDESIIRGMFRRAYNPTFGKRPRYLRKEE